MVSLGLKGRLPSMTEPACAFCGKSLMAEAQVHEGEKLFHLDCYLLYKRRSARALVKAV
jgi:hypothetical protein